MAKRSRSLGSELDTPTPSPGLDRVPVEEPAPVPAPADPAPAPKPNSTSILPKPSAMVTGQGARDPNRAVATGQLRVAAAVWANMTSVPVTSRAGFIAWCGAHGHTEIRTSVAWASLFAAYERHPVGRK